MTPLPALTHPTHHPRPLFCRSQQCLWLEPLTQMAFALIIPILKQSPDAALKLIRTSTVTQKTPHSWHYHWSPQSVMMHLHGAGFLTRSTSDSAFSVSYNPSIGNGPINMASAFQRARRKLKKLMNKMETRYGKMLLPKKWKTYGWLFNYMRMIPNP